MKRYDIILKMLTDRMSDPIYDSVRDVMSLVTLYNTNPPMAQAEFTKMLAAIYLLHIADLPLDGVVFDNCRPEFIQMILAIETFRDKLIGVPINDELERYIRAIRNQRDNEN